MSRLRHLIGAGLCMVACARSSLPGGDAGGDPSEGLALTPASLHFAARAGRSPEGQQVVVADVAGGTPRWRAAADVPWIDLDPTEGTAPSVLTVRVATAGLAVGTWTGVLTVAAGPQDATARVLVELTLEAPGWTALGGPASGRVFVVASDPSDPARVLVGRDGGVHLSTDAGEGFVAVPIPDLTENDRPLAFALRPSGRGYLALGRWHEAGAAGLLRTDDRGATWTRVGLTGEPLVGVAAGADDDEVLAAGLSLWRSADGGVNWSETAVPSGCTLLWEAPGGGRYLVGAADGSLYSTTDGAALTPLPLGPADPIVSVAALADGRWLLVAESWSSRALFASDDQGATWGPWAPMGLPQQLYDVRLALRREGNRLWALGESAYASEDDGATFRRVLEQDRPLGPAGAYVDAVPIAGSMLLANRRTGLWRATGGASLGQVAGLMASPVIALAIDSPSGTVFGAARDGGVFRWSAAGGFAGLAGLGLLSQSATAISFDPRDVGRLAVGFENGPDSAGGFYSTTNAGTDWTAGAVGLGDAGIRTVARAPDDPDTLWVGLSYAGLHRSIDGGLTFEAIGPPTVDVPWIVALSRDVALYSGGAIYRADFGPTLPVNTTVLDTCCTAFLGADAAGGLWVQVSGEALQRSGDGGQTFEPYGLSGVAVVAVAAAAQAPSRLWAIAGERLLGSEDGGATWSDLGAPFPARALALDESSGSLYVGTAGGGLYRFTP